MREIKECVECGEQINPKRVEVFPEVERCLGCQETYEHKGHFRKHVMDVQAVCKAGEIDELKETIVRAR